MNSVYTINKELGKFIDVQNNKKYDLYSGYSITEPLDTATRDLLINDSTCFEHLPVYGGDVQNGCPEARRNLCFGDDNTEFEVVYDKKLKTYYLLLKVHTWFGCEEYTDLYKYMLPWLNGYNSDCTFKAYLEYDCVNIYNNGFFVLSLGLYTNVMECIQNEEEIIPIYNYNTILGGLH